MLMYSKRFLDSKPDDFQDLELFPVQSCTSGKIFTKILSVAFARNVLRQRYGGLIMPVGGAIRTVVLMADDVGRVDCGQ